ncbi:MAG: hypothetical protein M3N38_07275, partial [Pseudomonadota bacterium]|nr:hypothetical protein [Pseudomonadota bacterium]
MATHTNVLRAIPIGRLWDWFRMVSSQPSAGGLATLTAAFLPSIWFLMVLPDGREVSAANTARRSVFWSLAWLGVERALFGTPPSAA